VFKNAKIIRLVPDQPGMGGSKTSLTTQSHLVDTYRTINAVVFYGRWRKVIQAVATGLASVANTVGLALHNFAKLSITNALISPTNIVLSHGSVPGAPTVHKVFDHTNNFTVKTGSSTPDSFVPATFLTIKQRCFICWAGSNNFIYDGTAASAGVYDVGVNGPASAPAYAIANAGTGTLFATNGGNKVARDTGPAWSNAITSINIAGAVYKVTAFNAYVAFGNPGVATGTSGTNVLTITAAWLTPGDFNGLHIEVPLGGAQYLIYDYTVAAGVTTVTLAGALATSPAGVAYALHGDQLSLASNYTGPTAQSQVYTVYSGVLSWTSRGPQYAYAYYDPITGHVSNVSPIELVTEENQIGVNITLSAIIDSVVGDRARFTKIIIFRTIITGGGNTLFPIGDGSGNILLAFNNDGTGPHTFTDNHPDSDLLVNGGLQAPISSNAKPPVCSHMAYWDSRVWGIPVNDPTSVIFSGDVVQVPFGVPEESYPVNNKLRIPAEDGNGLGMKLVGGILIITTQRYAYYVTGSFEGDYRLLRFSSTTYGVGDYQMIEFAGDTSDNSASLVYLSRDKQMYMLAQSYGNVPISSPIQDAISAQIGTSLTAYQSTRITSVGVDGQKYVILAMPSNNFIYDFNRKIWTETSVEFFNGSANVVFVPQAFALQYGGSRPVDLLVLNAGTVYAWLRNEGPRAISTGSVWTPPLNFDRKARRQANFVRLYVSDPSPGGASWLATLVPDELFPGVAAVAAVNTDPAYQLQPPGSTGLDNPNAKEMICTFPQYAAEQIWAYRWQVIVSFPPGTTPSDIYAVEFCYSEAEEPDQVGP
jgi:hypothetical protein